MAAQARSSRGPHSRVSCSPAAHVVHVAQAPAAPAPQPSRNRLGPGHAGASAQGRHSRSWRAVYSRSPPAPPQPSATGPCTARSRPSSAAVTATPSPTSSSPSTRRPGQWHTSRKPGSVLEAQLSHGQIQHHMALVRAETKILRDGLEELSSRHNAMLDEIKTAFGIVHDGLNSQHHETERKLKILESHLDRSEHIMKEHEKVMGVMTRAMEEKSTEIYQTCARQLTKETALYSQCHC